MKPFRLAAVLSQILRAVAQKTLFTGTGTGTYYYDIHEVQVRGIDFTDQNMGNVGCSASALSLDQISSNYIVAINNTQLHENLPELCGKKVILYVNGRRSNVPLFVGDGCARCAVDSGVDLSYSVLNDMMQGMAWEKGHTTIRWEILDQNIYTFDTASEGRSPATGTSREEPCATPSAKSRRAPLWT